METSFVSEETFSQGEFQGWLERRSSADLHRYELVGGRIVMSPPAGMLHGALEARLVHLLSAHVLPRDLGAVLGSSAGYDLPTGDTLEPDASFIAAAAMRAVPRPLPDRFSRIVPSLVVEVLSVASARRDRVERRLIYASNGVAEYWIVDARRRQVVVHDLASDDLVPRAPCITGPVASRVLPDLHLTVEEVFADIA